MSEGGDPACWAGEDVARPVGTPRPLSATETGELLNADLVARLATVDGDGFPHVTPIWFVWDGEAFLLSSLRRRPHVERVRSNPKVGLVIDTEAAERPDGERPNRQVRVWGEATVEEDVDDAVSFEVARKYASGPGLHAILERRRSQERVVLRLVPTGWVAVAST